ncbi:abscisic-aldehyde oxidase-like [Gossypium australe]|uniref:Abscisic-aldehyde oxidase-like n=1 Tax=Gossypium australe TaxID=47621 RepID=A0A5B6XA11_9ROSI|nr:abscisic-aldehyde oxidase-like [Gossypium australe]
MYVNRKTDMIMAGGRHPMKITYSVGFKSNGKITALKLDILVDAGMSADISPVMPHNIIGSLKKYDWGALAFDIKVCKTNLPSRSAMRAPGEVQASFIAEAVIEHVASSLALEVDSVRSINLHKFETLKLFFKTCAGEPLEYTLPSIWDKLAISSNFYHRTEMLKEFNRCNKWRKRGISRIPIVHPVMLRATPGKVSILRDGSIVVEVGGIELGQGLWTKVKQMTAYALSLIQCAGTEELLEKVRVIQADTLSLIQGGFTAGSTTSESSCEAVRLCCNILVERLTALKERLEEQMGPVKWETLILQLVLPVPSLTVQKHLLDRYSGQFPVQPVQLAGPIEGAFVQGIGFFMLEEYPTNSKGLVVAEGTWSYKIPTVPATMPVVKELCGLENVQRFLQWTIGSKQLDSAGGTKKNKVFGSDGDATGQPNLSSLALVMVQRKHHTTLSIIVDITRLSLRSRIS